MFVVTQQKNDSGCEWDPCGWSTYRSQKSVESCNPCDIDCTSQEHGLRPSLQKGYNNKVPIPTCNQPLFLVSVITMRHPLSEKIKRRNIR